MANVVSFGLAMKPCKITALLAILLSSLGSVRAQQKPLQPETLRIVQLNNLRLATLLASFAADYQITIGFETDPQKPDPAVTLELRDVTLSQILDAIVQTEPGYQWRHNGEFIEFLPVSDRTSLLDTSIGTFQVRDVTAEAAINQVMALPAIQAATGSLKALRRPALPARFKDEKTFSFNLTNVTLREALNHIAGKTNAKFWLFRWYTDGSFSVSITP